MNMFATFASGVLNQYVLSGTLNKPATMAFGLTTVVPTLNQVTEVANVAGYARQSYGPNTVGTTFWDYNIPLTGGFAVNRSPIFFPVLTAPGLGMVSGCFIADNAGYGLGNILWYGTLPTPKDLQVSDQFYIPASGASIRFS